MENLVRDIGITIAAVLICARWWYIAKEAASRKYILLFGVFFFITGVAYIIGKSFDIPGLMIIGFFTFIGAIYSGIKAIRSERRAKKFIK